MKKIILFILFVSFCCPAILFSETQKNSNQTKPKNCLADCPDYRYNPFQWIYPEYFYKAEVIRVQKEDKPQGTNVEFFGLTAYIPSKYAYEIERKHDILYFKPKTGDRIDRIIMIKSSDSSIICSDVNYTKDLCSAYKTPQEYYHKLFTLTPDTAESMGDKWLVHGKGVIFADAEKIEIYSSDKYIAYVRYIKDSLVKKIRFSHEITLFHVNGPINSYVNISFLTKDDTFLKHFISTIE